MPKKIDPKTLKKPIKQKAIKKIVPKSTQKKTGVIPTKAMGNKNPIATKKNAIKKQNIENFLLETTTDTSTVEPGLLPEIEHIPAGTQKEKKFVAITEYDRDELNKIRTVRIIISIFTVALVGFWIFTIKNDFNKPTPSDFSELSQKTNETISKLRQTLNPLNANASTSTDETDIQQIKNEVLQKLQTSIDSGNWPNHTSDNLRLTINFPPDWYKMENGSSLILATASSTNPTSRIKITKIANPKNISLADWLKKNPNIISGYQKADEPDVVGNNPALKYAITNPDNSTLRSLIFTIVNKNIYQIDVFNDQPLNQIILDNIISSIKFN